MDNHPDVVYSDLLSYTAPFCNLLLFLTGIPTCLRFARASSVGSKQPGPFVVGTLCSAVWTKYGLIVEQPSIWRVNLLGMVLNLGYTMCYINYAGPAARRGVVKVSAALAAAFTVFILYLGSLHSSGAIGQENERAICGLTGAVMSICFAGSSLDALKTVIKEKSTQSLQKPFILMVLAVTSQWCLYGRLIGDQFVFYPNAASAAVAAAQLALFCVYPAAPTKGTADPARPFLDV